MKKLIILVIVAISLSPIFQKTSFAQTINDYLITNDIGSYRKLTGGGPSGSILTGADHFYLDHSDKALDIAYVNDAQKMWIDVEVTQHTGGDSDRWLLHEVERSFRRGNVEENMTSSRFRNIDGNNVFYSGLGGGHYRWLNNNVVIDISYTDLYKQKPEPIEVVKAYLVKFPSTISNITIDNTHNVQWIRDEMDRRLWLCDKWNAQFQAGKTTEKDLIYNLFRSIKVFLLYRDKYYGVSANDLKALEGYRQSKDLTSIQTKLTEYKTWWNANKGKSISL